MSASRVTFHRAREARLFNCCFKATLPRKVPAYALLGCDYEKSSIYFDEWYAKKLTIRKPAASFLGKAMRAEKKVLWFPGMSPHAGP